MILKSVLFVFLFAGITFGQDIAASALKAFDKDKNANKAFAVAKDAFEKGQVGEAQKILLILKEHKKDAELLDLLAKVWEKFGVIDNAKSNYEEAELVDAKNIGRKYILADMYFKNNQIKESINKYLEITKLDSTSKEAYLKVGTIFNMTKEYKADAALYLEKALKFYSDLKIYKDCVKAYRDANNPAKAFEVAERGLEKYPNDVDLRRIAWQSAIPVKNYEAALKHVVLIPDSVLSANEAKTAGDVANVLGKGDLNIRYYKLAADKDPNNKDLFFTLANNAYGNKEYDKAIELFDKKLAIDPKHEKSLFYKAWSYKLKKDWEGARKSFNDYLAVYDTSVSGWINLAEVYDDDKLDSLGRKVEIYNKILKMIDGREKQYRDVAVSINMFLGYRAYTNKNWGGAIPYIKTAMAYKGEDLSSLVMIGACYENLKDYDNAVAYYKRAQRINPNDENVKKGLRRLSAD